MSTMPLLWMFALNFFCFAASTRFDAPALTFLVVAFVFVFVRRRRDNNKELSERVFYERKKRRLRCSRRRRVLLLLNRARCAPSSSGVLCKRVDITSTPPRGNVVSSVCPIQTIIQRARKRDTKTRARVLKTSFLTRRRRRTQRERERENKTHAAVILPTILFVSQRGEFL
mgnify:CR=1 FL=1